MTGVYDTVDLARFEAVLAEALGEVQTLGLGHDPEDALALRRRMAAAIFDCAAAGEHDPERFKRQALAAAFGRLTLAPDERRRR